MKDETAANHGIYVAENVKKCAPKPMKTTHGKVLPSRNSPMPAKMRSIPPKKTLAPLKL